MTTTDYKSFLAEKRSTAKHDGPTVAASDVHPMLHDWQNELVRWAVTTRRAALWADTGLGKAQPIDEPVLTPNGWRPIGSVAVGDQVYSADGMPTRVIGVYPQGERRIMRVTLNDGASTRCDEDHLWTVATDLHISRGKPWRTMTTRQLLDGGLTESANRWRWRVPVTRAIEHQYQELPIDPYVMGVMLGDGSFRYPFGPLFTVIDDQIASEVKHRLPDDMRLTRDDKGAGRAANYRPVMNQHPGSGGRVNRYLAALRDWGLQGHYSHEKFIPDQFLIGSVTQRIDLLRGLMDTDGYVSDSGTVQFGSSSAMLADGVAQLVRSLGGVVRRSEKMPTYHHGGQRRTGRRHYTLTIAMPDGIVPFMLARKVERCADRYYQPQRKIAAIEPEGSAQCVCIAVENPSRLYITRDHIVTHNTFMQVEWARLSGDRALIVAPLAVCQQTIREAAKLGVVARYLREDDGQPGIIVTNYEMASRFDPAALDAVVLDEASILKQSDGKTRTALIEQFRHVPARLACTATPAPNDPEELTNQAEFLGRMARNQMLAAYFVHDDQGWRLKGHARRPMLEWMATWAVALRKPSDLGYADDGYNLPGLEIVPHLLAVPLEAEGQLFPTDLGGVGGRAAVRKETLVARCERAAELIAAEPGEPWLIWCGLNDEAETMARLTGALNITGSMTPEQKADGLLGFTDGIHPRIVTKPSLASFGLNWQHCARMVFVGLGDSYEAYYQAIRRCYRYGQTRPVVAHVVLSQLESQIATNIARKERQATGLSSELVAVMRAARTENAA